MYGTLSAFRTYATARGDNAPTAAADPVASAALVRASDYIRTRYVLRFTEGYDETVPEVEEATYIAAQREVTKPGFWAATYTPAQTKTMVQFAAIRWQVDDRGAKGLYGAELMTPVDARIDALLAPYLSARIGHFVV